MKLFQYQLVKGLLEMNSLIQTEIFEEVILCLVAAPQCNCLS